MLGTWIYVENDEDKGRWGGGRNWKETEILKKKMGMVCYTTKRLMEMENVPM